MLASHRLALDSLNQDTRFYNEMCRNFGGIIIPSLAFGVKAAVSLVLLGAVVVVAGVGWNHGGYGINGGHRGGEDG